MVAAAYIRNVSNVLHKSGRALATVATSSPSSSVHAAPDGPLRPHLRVPVNPNHGLYKFFRRKTDKNSHTKPQAGGEPEYVAFEPPADPSLLSGRAWEATELRRKSFKDLHTLWYILLREQNLLATQAAEKKKHQIIDPIIDVRVRYCRKSMARIKAVISERQYAYLQALRLRRQPRDKDGQGGSVEKVEDGPDALLESGEDSVITPRTP